jgi:CRP-like cAMP-binding protein
MELLFESMVHLELPQNLKKRILMYYDHIWKEYRTLDGTITYFIPELSKQLSSEVYLYLRTNLILSVPFLRQCSPEVVRELVLRLKSEIFLPSDYIVHKDAPGAEMFLISKGICEVTIPDVHLEQKTPPPPEKKKRGRGEGRRRSSADMLVGAVGNFTDFLAKKNQKLAEEKEKETAPLELEKDSKLPAAKQRKSYINQVAPAQLATRLSTFRLADMPSVNDLPGMITSHLPGHEEEEKRKAEEAAQKKADEEAANTSFGQAQVVHKEKVVKELLAGEYFGEICLVLQTSRTCNVRAKTFCELNVLMSKDFNEVVVQFEDEKKVLEEIIMEKYKDEAGKWELQKKKKEFNMEDFIKMESNNQMQHDNTTDMLQRVLKKMDDMESTIRELRHEVDERDEIGEHRRRKSAINEQKRKESSSLFGLAEKDNSDDSDASEEEDDDGDEATNEAVTRISILSANMGGKRQARASFEELSGDVSNKFKQSRRNISNLEDKLKGVVMEVRSKGGQYTDFHLARMKVINNQIHSAYTQVDEIDTNDNPITTSMKSNLIDELVALKNRVQEQLDDAAKKKLAVKRMGGK